MKKYRQAVSALVLRPSAVCSPDGCGTIYEVLLVHKPRRSDSWQLPQGGIEEGETSEQAAIRELKEEAGLDMGSAKHISEATYCYDFPPSFVQRYNPVNAGQKLCFVLFVADQNIKVTVDQNEIDAYKWVLPEQLSQLVERKEYLDVIMQVFEEVKEHLKV